MSCGSCTFILKRTLRAIDGVDLVKVYYDKRLAVVIFENTVVDIQQLSEAIEETGFFPSPWESLNSVIDIQLQSTLTCPHCQHQKTEQMPNDYCQFFWDCPHCHKQLKPKEGDCCVYCSYGSIKCPPILQGESCS